MKHEALHMEQCIDLAVKGFGTVNPNPMVGAVLVKGGKVVSTGYHRRFGGPHAERECLRKAGSQARGGTLYVNLEPCIHHGKTPPCVDAIIAANVHEVVVAMKDPDPRVSGKGLTALRKAGIRVRTGVLEKEAKKLNEKFLWWHTKGIPFVGLKWAQSLDGYVADTFGRSKWITGEDARRYAHYLRSGYDGILVGAGTVMKDDPLLTVRHGGGNDPVRIIVDGRLRVSGREKVFGHRTGRTIVLTTNGRLRSAGIRVRRLLSQGVEVLGVGDEPIISPRKILRVIAGEQISSILIEGGPRTIRQFYDARLFNKYHVFVRAALLGGGAPALPMVKPVTLRTLGRTRGSDLLLFEDGDVLIEGGPS